MGNAMANQIQRNAVGTAATALNSTENTQVVALENQKKWEMEVRSMKWRELQVYSVVDV